MTSLFYSWFEIEINFNFNNYTNFEFLIIEDLNFFFLNNIINFFTIIFYTYVKINLEFTTILDLIDLFTYYDVLNISNLLTIYYTVSLDLFIHLVSILPEFSLNYINLNFLYLILYHDNDIIFAVHDYIYLLYDSWFTLNIFNIYKSYTMSNYNINVNFINYIIISLLLFLILNLTLKIFQNLTIKFKINFFFTKIFLYFYNLSKEIRINFEILIQLIFFLIFIWAFNLINYDDINVEFIELFHIFLVYFFLFIIIYLFFKYSIHYFSFLEPSVTEGKSNSFITKQFVRDISNTFALFLRFFLLLFRLNIYDGLDDFLDSYCFFFYDYDDDISFYDLNISVNNNYYNINNFNDTEFQDIELNIYLNDDFYKLFNLYFFEFLFYIIFILEVLFRISLALYITYLIIFEVHSVNCSYNEDKYILIKKNIK